jgi:arsenate reductase-like glutaredoxin family protein
MVAKAKWAEYRAKQITRAELEAWLKGREDEKAIRKLFNQMRG